MRLTMLGSGNAVVMKCHNICFMLQDEQGLGLLAAGTIRV